MQPAIPKINNLKTCARCKQNRGVDAFTKTTSYLYPDGTLPICNDCVNKYLEKFDYSWDAIDMVCPTVKGSKEPGKKIGRAHV